MQQGITFDATGEDGPVKDRPFPLDLVPRILPAAEWTTIKRGLAQRIRALNRFVDDVYHAREIVRAGIVPWRLIVTPLATSRAPRTAIRPPGGVYCHVAGCDLVRDADGTLEGARGQRPHAVGDLLRAREPRRDDAPGARSSSSTTACARSTTTRSCCSPRCAPSRPAPRTRPTVVVWTPGPMNSAYFEHAFLARQMGVELVEASDLVVRDDVLYMRTTAGLQRVHAVYRRLDDDFVDPLEFRPDSLLGVPGLVRAYRAGTVAIANALGTGVADDKADLPLRAGDDPLLPGRGADPRQRPDLPAGRPRAARARARPPATSSCSSRPSESGGKGVFIGPATPPRRARGAGRRDPRRSPSAGSPRRSSTSRPSRPRCADGALAPAPRRPAPVRRLRRGRSGSSPAA